jgi:hypothetical protein
MKGKRTITTILAAILLLVLAVGLGSAQSPVSGAITYQGRLTDSGDPADGAYDFVFRLYDAASGGTLVGGPLSLEDVAVSDGLFTVQLDFGGNAFNGEARWLAISVRPGASTGMYTPLDPRQELTAAPYAHHALGASWAGLSDVPAGLDDGDDDTTYTAGEGLSLSLGNQFSVSFAGSGTAGTASRSDHDHWGQSWSGSGTGLTLGSGTRGLVASGSEYGVHAEGGSADLLLAGTSGVLRSGSYSNSGLEVYSNDNVEVHLDDDASNPNASFRIYDSGDASIFVVEEDGDVHIDGNVECSGCVAGDDVEDGSLTADDVDPAGGIYSDKSAIYVNTESMPVEVGTCVQIQVTCDDANDLPLQGVCTPPLGSYMDINAERLNYWNSATSPASYSCDVCNYDSSITEILEASLACISKP